MYHSTVVSSLSASSSLHPDLQAFIIWLLVNIVLALLPLIFSCLILAFITDWEVEGRHYLNLLKDGQLYIFSATLAASLVSKLLTVLQNDISVKTDPTTISGIILLAISALVLLIFSASFFGVTMHSAFKLSSEEVYNQLQIMQYRLNCLIKRYNQSIPAKKSKEFSSRLRDINDKKLYEVDFQLKQAREQVKCMEQQLAGQIPQSQYTGKKDTSWGIAITSIFLTVLVCLLSAYAFYAYGGM
ncbi:MAG: hypothetical protein JOZ71_08120 [Ktedonobacteraceae bacterium]|nr:hypothetical protein [Ktedonobacteraceae bacterium]